MQRLIFILLVVSSGSVALQTDSGAEAFKKLPPAGIDIQDSVRKQLMHRIKELRIRSDLLAKSLGDSRHWLPDVEVLIRAVDLAVRLDGFYREQEITSATTLLDEAERRLEAAARGLRGVDLLGFDQGNNKSPQTLVGGYRSRIDDSVQPYGIVLPIGYQTDKPKRMDVWLHGRGDTKTEIAFLSERQTKVGQFAPNDTVVLHPFGRHCNAFKFAGETDVLESIEHLSHIMTIDPHRIAIRGFSMGGAGCWHLAVHHPSNWFAANPGAGFVDTLIYQGWGKSTPFPLTQTRKKLLNWYDVLPWVDNLRHLPTVAYSGEIDKQRQAADRVIEEATKRHIAINYIVGEKMGHRIDQTSADKIEATLDGWNSQVRSHPRPTIDFTTYTLRYSQADWLQIVGLREHWTPGRVQASVQEKRIEVSTSGVTGIKIDIGALSSLGKSIVSRLVIDGEILSIPPSAIEDGFTVQLGSDQKWKPVTIGDTSLKKRPGLQGPIDDAFCDRFLFVAPTQSAAHESIQLWIDREFEYAKNRWKTLMRGDVRVVRDDELTDEMIQNHHLICFGDFSSNRFLTEIQSELPLVWNRDQLRFQSRQFDPSKHVMAMCYPNPKNQDKYIVINSGMTFREFSNVSNSRQIAMLPDWAILRTDVEDEGIFPGEIVLDGFFDENWQ